MNNPLVQVDPGLFIWTIVTFLVLLTLLAKFAWRPLLQALAAREETIRKSLADAREGAAGARAAESGVRGDHPAGARRGRSDHRREPRRRRAAARRAAGQGAGRGRRHHQERRAADSARDRARARADSPRGRRSFGGDRVEAHSEEHHEGRQRAADRGRAEAVAVRSVVGIYCVPHASHDPTRPTIPIVSASPPRSGRPVTRRRCR